MRILYISSESPLIRQAGGIATYIGEALRALRSMGHEVALVTWGPIDARQSWNQEWLDWLGKNSLFWQDEDPDWQQNFPGFSQHQAIAEQLVSTIRQAVALFQPDIIEATDYQAPVFSYLERIRAGLENVTCPVVIFNHGLSLDTWIHDAHWPADELILEDFQREISQLHWADGVICPSHTAQRRLLELGVAAEKITMIREPYTFPPEKPNAGVQRTWWAHLGRFNYRKGADALIYHLNQILGTTYAPEGLRILGEVGDSAFRDPDFQTRLQSRVAPEWSPNIAFVGRYQRDALPVLLSDVRFVAQFSRFETFGYTTVETLAHGAVPLLARESAMAELVPAPLLPGLLDHVYADPQELQRVLTFWSEGYEEKKVFWRSQLAQLLFPEIFAQNVIQYYQLLHKKGGGEVANVQSVSSTAEDVTILIPHRNDFDNLLVSLESVYALKNAVAEIILLDDGSDADVQPLLARLQDLPRLRILHQNNQGLCASRNHLVDACRTEWCVFLDSDDRLHPDFVSACLSCASKAQAIIPRRQNFGDNALQYPQTTIGSPMHWIYNHFRMTALIQTDCLRQLRFDPSMRHGEADDWDFWLRFHLHGYHALTYPEALFYYQFKSGSMSWPWSSGQALKTEALLQERLMEARQDEKTQCHAELGGIWRSLYHARRLIERG
ncbi:putative glycosyltransferase EpsH [Acidithiobacillus thiooxidans ATCC 19377]|uniref:Putative glycosyltransferase EpsH n=1 Tax=Acidithiobacillus thiooxidans ATCC 19377 TaxID=637390 RepID=A0A543PZA0_ACITH|nr:glycosyltransferase [Acidithiobacillus thiooxidans]MDX5936497.1 glycosyltransferase [Acidithiobacillus thiooxidans]TQN49402.1 putative glycosyltransferase EpsH [Acidithiobacillus thiooxidans ATCC 19377]